MALIKCPECGKEISDKAPTCPNCGYPINTDTPNGIKESKRLSGKVFFIIGILCWVAFFVYRLSIADDYLGERAYYITHGYYRTSLIPVCQVVTPIMEWGGLILVVIGIVQMIVFKKNH